MDKITSKDAQRILSKEEIKACKECFDCYDKLGYGTLEAEELQKVLEGNQNKIINCKSQDRSPPRKNYIK